MVKHTIINLCDDSSDEETPDKKMPSKGRVPGESPSSCVIDIDRVASRTPSSSMSQLAVEYNRTPARNRLDDILDSDLSSGDSDSDLYLKVPAFASYRRRDFTITQENEKQPDVIDITALDSKEGTTRTDEEFARTLQLEEENLNCRMEQNKEKSKRRFDSRFEYRGMTYDAAVSNCRKQNMRSDEEFARTLQLEEENLNCRMEQNEESSKRRFDSRFEYRGMAYDTVSSNCRNQKMPSDEEFARTLQLEEDNLNCRMEQHEESSIDPRCEYRGMAYDTAASNYRKQSMPSDEEFARTLLQKEENLNCRVEQSEDNPSMQSLNRAYDNTTSSRSRQQTFQIEEDLNQINCRYLTQNKGNIGKYDDCDTRTVLTSKRRKLEEKVTNQVRGDDRVTAALDKIDLIKNPILPRAISRSSSTSTAIISSTVNGQRQCEVRTPSLPDLELIGGKQYPDLRNHFIKMLVKHARAIRNHTYQRKPLDLSIKAINSLALYPYPIRTSEATGSIEGIGEKMIDIIQKSHNKLNLRERRNPYNPPIDKFSSAAAAALVALLDFEEEQENQGALCPMETLIQLVNTRGHNSIDPRMPLLSRDIEYYKSKDNFDPGWMQIVKLCGGNLGQQYVKQRSRKKVCASGLVFQLQADGRREACALKYRASMPTAAPGPFRQLAAATVGKEYGNVTISMDFREGGAGNKRKLLHQMCDFFDTRKIPFVVRELKISDYVFFIGSKLAPILIERKRMEDVAASLSDGRWERQQRGMRKAQFVLGGGEKRNCKICYLIEGSIKKTTIHGGFVGNREYGKTIQDVENAIASLPRLGFSVLRCNTTEKSLQTIAQVAKQALYQFNSGSMECTHTYDDFVAILECLNEEEGDAPKDSRHQNPDAPDVVRGDILLPRLVNNIPRMPNHVQIVTNPAPGEGVHIAPRQAVHIQDIDQRGDSERRNHVQRVINPAPRQAVRVQDIDQSGTSEDRNHVQRDTHIQLQERMEELMRMKVAELKQYCKARGEKISGKKSELIARLLRKPKPEIIVRRLTQNQYVPNIPSCGAAILVALHLHHVPGTPGIEKKRLMSLADETGICKDLMYGNPESRSPYDYNGWSAMAKLTEGDPRLVFVKKQRYALTRFPVDNAGTDVAKALHMMAHDENLCNCGKSLDSI